MRENPISKPLVEPRIALRRECRAVGAEENSQRLQRWVTWEEAAESRRDDKIRTQALRPASPAGLINVEVRARAEKARSAGYTFFPFFSSVTKKSRLMGSIVAFASGNFAHSCFSCGSLYRNRSQRFL